MAAITVQGFPTPAGPLDVVIEAGARARIVGPNGVGKTSLLRCIAGLPAALSASCTVEALDPTRLPAPRLAQRLAMVHQDPRDGLIGFTVASEHRFRGLRAPRDHRAVATLSSGEARGVALSVSQAPILLLDEPVEGLDAAGLERLRLRVQAHEGTVVFVDHDGRLADLATQTITLAPPSQPALPAIAAGQGPPWQRPASTSDEPRITLPALALTPGLHALVGPNGCGKTTALRHWAGIGVKPEPEVAWMGPRARDLLVTERVGDLLPTSPLADRHPLTLSGGEAQRVALESTFARDQRVLLLDEPEAHLDGDGRAWLVARIADAVAAGRIVLVATHDPALIALAHSTIPMEPR